MRVSLLSVLALLFCGCSLFQVSHSAAPTFSPTSYGWTVESNPAPSDSLLYLQVGLRLRDVPGLEAFAHRVSDPTSSSYGKYLSLSQVSALFGPTPATVATVSRYFTSVGALSVSVSASNDMMDVVMPVSAVSALLNGASFAVYRHTISGRTITRTTASVSDWSFPSHIASAIEIVTGAHDFLDTPLERKGLKQAAVAAAREVTAGSSAPEVLRMTGTEVCTASVLLFCSDGLPTSNGDCSNGNNIAGIMVDLKFREGFGQKATWHGMDNLTFVGLNEYYTPTMSVPRLTRVNVTITAVYMDGSRSLPGSLPNLWSPSAYASPRTIHSAYSVPIGTRGTNPNNSIAVGSFELQYYSNDDLTSFFADHGMPVRLPTVRGFNNQSAAAAGGEASLDIDYISGTAPGVPATFWSVGGPGPTHGDHAYVLTWAYLVGNDTNPPLVTSLSYGDTEMGYFRKFGSFSYLTRMDTELAKMAARGLTVLAGSGDAGASNVGEAGNDISGTDPTCGPPLRPFYPSNSQYVVSVSATFFSPMNTPVCSESYTGVPLPVVCDNNLGEVAVGVSQGSRWTTGGGFSNWTMQTSWQAEAVEGYIAMMGSELPPDSYWNRKGRGYPDVSAMGHNLLCRWAGKLLGIDGTSAAGPVMAGIVALLNEARLNAGKPPMGLITPFFYQSHKANPASFNDVVVGDNRDGDLQLRGSPFPTFCEYGFETSPGWDPVSGLGTPNAAILTEMALAAAK